MDTLTYKGVKIPYSLIREKITPSYVLTIKNPTEVATAVECIEQGECNYPSRGDKYITHRGQLLCSLSTESFLVLLRRLSEREDMQEFVGKVLKDLRISYP